MAKTNTHSMLPVVTIVCLLTLFSSIAIWLVHFEPDRKQTSDSESRSATIVKQITNAKRNEHKPMLEAFEKADIEPPISSEMSWLSRPTWQLDGLLTDKLPELQSAYEHGDQAAGFMIAAYLSRCDKAPSSKEDLEAKVEFAIEMGEADLVDRLTQGYKFCLGVPTELREEHLKRFIRLSEDGFTPALEVIGSIPSKQYMEHMQLQALPREEYIIARDTFEKAKYHYLSQAAQQGSMLALLKLSHLNAHSPKHIQESSIRGHTSLSLALANATVAKHFTKNDLVYGRAEFIQNRLYQQATAKELFLAESLSAKMISEIQRAGQAYSAQENERWVFTFY